jgi:hypothetical protein
MFGAWGSALDSNGTSKLLQLRALDWDMDGKLLMTEFSKVLRIE